MRHLCLSVVAVAGLAGAANAQIVLERLATIDLTNITANPISAKFIGTSGSAVAWDGRSLWVAGYNNSGTGGRPVGISKIGDVYGSPSFGDSFGVQSIPSGRGYRSLAVQNGRVLSGLEGGGAINDSLASWDAAVTTPAAPVWGINARVGWSDFDPGFNASGAASGAGAGWGTFNTNPSNRALRDAATGTETHSTATGGSLGTAPFPGTGPVANAALPRGLDFDPATGDAWGRVNNTVARAARTGENSFSAFALVASPNLPAQFPNQEGQNIEIARGSTFGDLAFFNNRGASAGSQLWSNVFRAINLAGVAQTISYLNFNPADAANNSIGFFDFSYDAASNTLAVLSFGDAGGQSGLKQVHIFAVPTPGAAALLGLGGLVAFRRRR